MSAASDMLLLPLLTFPWTEVPPGRFWELNVVRDCPKGLYREQYVLVTDKVAISCLPCPTGWTTPGISTTAIGFCNSECNQ
jgi:hypothetical protein